MQGGMIPQDSFGRWPSYFLTLDIYRGRCHGWAACPELPFQSKESNCCFCGAVKLGYFRCLLKSVKNLFLLMKTELREVNSDAKITVHKILSNDMENCIHRQTAYKTVKYFALSGPILLLHDPSRTFRWSRRLTRLIYLRKDKMRYFW